MKEVERGRGRERNKSRVQSDSKGYYCKDGKIQTGNKI